MELQPRLKILLVEDDHDYALIIKDQLSDSRYDLSHSSMLGEALDRLTKDEFDIVLLDLDLPDSNEIPNILRVHQVRPAIPVIVITSLVEDDVALTLARMGAQDYLPKGGFTGDVLRRSISYAIERTELTLRFESARSYAELTARQESVISNVGRILSSNNDLEATFEEFTNELSRLVQFDRAWIMLKDDHRDVFRESYATGIEIPDDLEELTIQSSGSVSEIVANMDRGMILSAEEVTSLSPTNKRAEGLIEAGLQTFLSHPLKNMGTVFGVVSLASKAENAYTEHDQQLLSKVANQIAGPIAQAEILSELRQLAHIQSSLALLGQAIAQSLDLEDVVKSAAPTVSDLMPAPHITLNLIDENKDSFVRRYVYGDEMPGYPEFVREQLAGSTTEKVVERKSPMILNGDELASGSQIGMQKAYEGGIRSILIVPLRVEGNVIGTIVWSDYVENRFDESNLDVAITVSMQLAGAIANCELHSRTVQRAEEQMAMGRLEAANNELRTANEVKSQIISNVSHELRTPLTSMLAFADMLNRDNEAILSEQYKVMVKMIRRAGRQLDLLIGDLLTMSSLQSGDFKLVPERFDLQKLLEEIADLMSSISSSKNQEIALEIAQDGLSLEADRARFAQVVQNIVGNASKYSPEGSVITISAEAVDDSISVSVTDQGEGMSDEDLQKLFKRFSRLDNDATRGEQGTGLGLHIVKKLVTLFGGHVDVKSEAGVGTTFTVQVPAVRSDHKTRDAA